VERARLSSRVLRVVLSTCSSGAWPADGPIETFYLLLLLLLFTAFPFSDDCRCESRTLPSAPIRQKRFSGKRAREVSGRSWRACANRREDECRWRARSRAIRIWTREVRICKLFALNFFFFVFSENKSSLLDTRFSRPFVNFSNGKSVDYINGVYKSVVKVPPASASVGLGSEVASESINFTPDDIVCFELGAHRLGECK